MATTHDGSDWNYRMVIEDRYKRLSVMRRSIKISAIVQIVYVCLRTLWHSVPFLTGEAPLTQSTPLIFYAGVFIFFFRAWAFGFGKANREQMWAIKVYSILSMLLASECSLVFYMYHVNPKMLGTTPDWQYPQMLAKHAAGRLGLAAGTLVFVCQWLERALDVVGIVASFLNVYVTKEYVMEKKEQAQEAAAKRD